MNQRASDYLQYCDDWRWEIRPRCENIWTRACEKMHGEVSALSWIIMGTEFKTRQAKIDDSRIILCLQRTASSCCCLGPANKLHDFSSYASLGRVVELWCRLRCQLPSTFEFDSKYSGRGGIFRWLYHFFVLSTRWPLSKLHGRSRRILGSIRTMAVVMPAALELLYLIHQGRFRCSTCAFFTAPLIGSRKSLGTWHGWILLGTPPNGSNRRDYDEPEAGRNENRRFSAIRTTYVRPKAWFSLTSVSALAENGLFFKIV